MILSSLAGAALIQAQPLPEAPGIEELRQHVARTTADLERALAEQQRVNAELLRRLEAMEARLGALSLSPATAPQEPARQPQGFGERQPSAALGPSPSETERQGTVALSRRRETVACQIPPPRSMAAEQVQEEQGTSQAPAAWQPSDPIRLGGQKAFLDLGLTGTVAAGGSTASDIAGSLELGGHDPNQRGFTLQGLELNLAGAVDPYFRANANLAFGLDADGESTFELEEAWAETMALPANLQLRAGQMYAEFGRHNPTHLHAWAFVDTPLVNGRLLGPDGLRNPGARLSWLAPIPFYSQVLVGVQNSQGETATGFRSDGGHMHGAEASLPFTYRHADNDRGVATFSDLLFTPRYEASWDLTRSLTLLLGGSAALGPNSRGGPDAGDTTTQIYGVDMTWKWKSPQHHGGFPFVSWQTEGLLRKYDAGAFDWDNEAADGLTDVVVDAATGEPARLAGETLTDYGFYTQVLWGFRRGWVTGLRLDALWGDRAAYESQALIFNGEALGRDPQRADRWRLSPNLTWYPTEYSRLRLQYNYDDRQEFGVDHSVWFQFEFSLGAHAAHRF